MGEGLLHGTAVDDALSTWQIQSMFCATAATIVSGGIAERADMRGYVLCSCVMSGIVYPLAACWCWNPDGWLHRKGFQDFAGSTVVHVVGGFGALCGAWFLGPRTGRFSADGRVDDSAEFAPHSVPFIVLGTMILWYGWFAFNAGSVGSLVTQEDFKRALLAATNTSISGVAGGIVAYVLRFMATSRWDLPFICNGILAGLVAICAGADSVRPISAFAIGGVAACLLSSACSALKWLRIDDPVSAFGVHGMGGLWGTIAATLFHMEGTVLGEPAEAPALLWQFTGVLTISTFSFLTCLSLFLCVAKLGLLKTSSLQQQRGLDRESNFSAYNTSGQVDRYSALVCHVKSSHGATARWMQMELGKYTGGKSRIFLDSEDLVNLTHLLSTVRDKVDVLVVLATRDIWWRPWCAGEITTASAAGIPIVLAMMAEGDKALDLNFKSLSQEVSVHLGQVEMDVLAPFGISHDDIQHAYEKLDNAPRVPFSVQDPMIVREAFDRLSRLAELNGMRSKGNLARWSSELMCAATGQDCGLIGSIGSVNCLGNFLSGRTRRFLLLGNSADMEAIAAMHIFEQAMLEVSEDDQESIDIFCCAMCPEAQVLGLVEEGMPMIILLSKGILECPLVHHACVLRASQMRSQGTDISSTSVSQTALLIHADRLDFDYPDMACYEDVQKNFLAHVEQSRGGGGADIPSKFDWSNLDYRDGQDCARALVLFYRCLFNQLALALSTHGSWRTILHQVQCVYERTKRLSLASRLDTMPLDRLGTRPLERMQDSHPAMSWSCPETERITPTMRHSPSRTSLHNTQQQEQTI
jgi:ammonium transporter